MWSGRLLAGEQPHRKVVGRALVKRNICEYYPTALTWYGRDCSMAILSAMVSSAQSGVHRTIPLLYGMLHRLVLMAKIAMRYACHVNLACAGVS